MERDVIEIAPLAYMRGRTLENAFIILDEAQNTTPQQMMMFLTRFGRGSKVVVTGDVTQIDLPMNQMSGLVDSLRVLRKVPGIVFVKLNEGDIVRHDLVQRIVSAYETAETEAALPLFRNLRGKSGGRPTRFAEETAELSTVISADADAQNDADADTDAEPAPTPTETALDAEPDGPADSYIG